MSQITLDFSNTVGKIKPMHAVNNGPLKKKADQKKDNYDSYAALGIPYARNHDAAFWNGYGGEHSVDISAVFPDFDADPCDPASYDFVLTDEYIERTTAAGTETFYRLGAKIEHNIKKYGTLPPKDFNKWAIICEHMIRHFNYGWADGHEYGLKYFEIWNEPDLDPDDSTNKRTWGGTKAQFFDFYEITAKHLKAAFPELKIGGPALAGNMEWGEDFLCEMQKRNVPIDFFSWHIYADNTEHMIRRTRKARELMVKYGYGDAESILNEWNYIKDWSDEFVYSIQQIIGMKGAAFTADVMCRLQHEPVDMLMYYDARPSTFNGIWDFYTCRQFKTYYSLKAFSKLYKLGYEVEAPIDIGGLGVTVATDRNGKGAVMLCYYTDNDSETAEKSVDISLSGIEINKLSVTLTDANNDEKLMPLPATNSITLSLAPNSFMLLSIN